MAAATELLTKVAQGAAALGVLGSLAQASLYTVDGGERAVLFDRFRGVLEETSDEGMHFLVRTAPSSVDTVRLHALWHCRPGGHQDQ